MFYGAIDLHMRYSQIRILDGDGRVVREGRVVTTPERLTAAFATGEPMRVLVETGTESEWVAQVLEAAGHTVIVADPNFAPMYGDRRRAVKTDTRDVAALAEANRRGWYRAAHRTSAPWSPSPSAPLSMIFDGFRRRPSSVPRWGSCPAKTAPASASSAGM